MSNTLNDALGERIDTKLDTVIAFSTFLEAFQKNKNAEPIELDGNDLIIITTFGNITCEIISLDEKAEVVDSELLSKTILEIRNKRYETMSPDTPIISNCKTLLLKNATVTPFANPINKFSYSTMALFTDQIVGVTFGKTNRD